MAVEIYTQNFGWPTGGYDGDFYQGKTTIIMITTYHNEIFKNETSKYPVCPMLSCSNYMYLLLMTIVMYQDIKLWMYSG